MALIEKESEPENWREVSEGQLQYTKSRRKAARGSRIAGRGGVGAVRGRPGVALAGEVWTAGPILFGGGCAVRCAVGRGFHRFCAVWILGRLGAYSRRYLAVRWWIGRPGRRRVCEDVVSACFASIAKV
jgi:hypothetical protein